MTARLTSPTLVPMRALDITRAVDLLAADPDVDPATDFGGREGNRRGPAPALSTRGGREGMLVSCQSVVTSRMHRGVFENVVRGVLESYDLPDLAAALSPRPALIVDAVDAMGERAPLESVRREYSALDKGRIVRRGVNQSAAGVFGEIVR